jgi:hypothetical protein
MRNIALLSGVRPDHRRRARERNGTAATPAERGSRVDNPGRSRSKRRRLVEVPPPEPAQQNGQKIEMISSRSLEQAWLKQHHTEYAGAWVALEGACLVAQGSSARQVLDAARSEGYDQPLIVHVPSEPPLPFGGW